MKHCSKCGTDKPATEFYFRHGAPDRWCKNCSRLNHASWRSRNRAHVNATNKAWKDRNLEKVRPAAAARARAARAADPEKHRAYRRTRQDWKKVDPEVARRRARDKARKMVVVGGPSLEKHRARTSEWRKNNPGFWRRYRDPVQESARRATRRAIARGSLVRPAFCSSCGVACKPDAHHPDHSKPLEVQWLCKRCHGLTWRIEARQASG